METIRINYDKPKLTFNEANDRVKAATRETLEAILTEDFGIKPAKEICRSCSHLDCIARSFYYAPIIECNFHEEKQK